MSPVDVAPVVSPASLAHTNCSFQFVAAASMDKVAPLFGADGERRWAGPTWDPQFFYPQPPQDIDGAVFSIQRSGHSSIWVNTQFDLQAGLIQYVAFIPDVMATIIDVRLTSHGNAATDVKVRYRRTALSTAANPDVERLGRSDAASGPEWQSAIAAALGN